MAIYAKARRAPFAAAAWLAGFVAALLAARCAADGPSLPVALPDAGGPLTLDAAVRMALLQNPEIIAARQDHGIAAAAVMVARAYPFNPVWESRTRYAFGAEFAGIFNHEPVENTVLLEVEIRGQGKYRTAAATAALSRTDWDVANQETALAIRVVRAFDGVVYHYQKIQLLSDTLALDKGLANLAPDLVRAGKLHPVDVILLRSEIDDIRAQFGMGRTALSQAWSELRAALGVVGGPTFDLQGDLRPPPLPTEPAPVLGQVGRERRADRHSREAAVAEADARLRLEQANRFGNPTVGPTYEYDNAAANNLGVTFSMPLPVLNAHRGDILQREAEKTRAAFDLHATDVLIDQEVEAALARLKHARAWADTYENDVLPNLEKSLKEMRELFASGDASVDALRILDVQRKVLTARNGLLDAQFEVRQAVADLAAALGDPSVAVGPCPAP